MKPLNRWLDGYDQQVYVAKLNAAFAAGQIRRGVVTEAVIMHDDGCALLAGKGLCDCSPDVKLVTPEVPCDRPS